MRLRHSKIIKNFLLWLGCLGFSSTALSCGYYKQQACASHQCNQNLVESGGICIISETEKERDKWIKKSIEPGYKNTDLNIDKLNMNSNDLKQGNENGTPGIRIVQASEELTNGTYVFVLRVSDGNLVIHPYDRDISTSHEKLGKGFRLAFDFSDYRNKKNYYLMKEKNGATYFDGPCDPNAQLNKNQLDEGAACIYSHVRHSQLNGTKPPDINGSYEHSDAWDPVYCAGELRVHMGYVDRINNNSGHFRPDENCVNHVKRVLEALNIPVSPNISFHMGDFRQESNEAYPIFKCDEYMQPSTQESCHWDENEPKWEFVQPGETICSSLSYAWINWRCGDLTIKVVP